MVDMNKSFAHEILETDIIDIPQEELNWGTVNLSEVINSGTRLEASVYNIEGRHARETLKQCKWPVVALTDMIIDSFYPKRFKRNYVEKNLEDAIGFLGSSEILEINPEPQKFLSSRLNEIESFKVKRNTILLSRSGTIGNLSLVNKTLEKFLVSEHVIRIICKDYPGYVYAFLKTKVGQLMVKCNIYGSVVDEIEPEYLQNVLIPNPPAMLKKQIHELVTKSYELRDKSNELLDKAEELLIKELELPPIDNFKPDYFDKFSELKNYVVRLSELQERFDASYHVPIIKAIVEHLKKHALEVTTIGDSRISKKVILPGRFKRVYVEEGQGVKFLGGREIFELDPSTNKFLSVHRHKRKIEQELSIKANSILTTSRGTLGKVALAPKHFEGWTISDNLIQIIPSSTELAGYLYVFLNSDYGYELIKRFTYGAVVDALEPMHILQVQVPILKSKTVQQTINKIALEANNMRYEAYKLEQEAIKIVNDEVIHKR